MKSGFSQISEQAENSETLKAIQEGFKDKLYINIYKRDPKIRHLPIAQMTQATWDTMKSSLWNPVKGILKAQHPESLRVLYRCLREMDCDLCFFAEIDIGNVPIACANEKWSEMICLPLRWSKRSIPAARGNLPLIYAGQVALLSAVVSHQSNIPCQPKLDLTPS